MRCMNQCDYPGENGEPCRCELDARASVLRRITVDVSPSAASEIDRLSESTGKSTAELFRSAMSLLRIVANAAEDGMEVVLVDPTGSKKPLKLNL